MRIDRSYLGNQNTYAENNPKCIVVHNTDNFAAGADARAHARAQHDGNFQNISAHYYVDDGDTAYQAAPHSRGCWHVGINYGGKNLFQQYGNKNSIGVEMCVQAGYNYEKAFENTAALVREIMRETGIPLERVYRHYDICSKYCPSQIMNRGDWDRMKRMIGSGAGSTGTGTAGSGTGKTYAPGIYQVQTAALNIRQAPDADSRIAGTIRDHGSYTVTEIQNTSWGRLLSGAGWVNCHTAYCRYAGPAKEKSAETAKSSGKTVAEDGIWGENLTRRLQELFGTPQDGKISNHPFGNKLLLTKLFYHGQILLLRHLHRERQHDAPGKLGVPLVLHGFHGVPEGRPVCISGRRMGRQHDLGVDKLFLLVVEFRFLVVLAEQPFAALVSGPGNSGLPLAALDDGNFEMRTRNRHHPLMTFESFSCKNHGIMVLLFWISKQKAGEPMSERKSQQELDFERKHEEDLQRLRGLRLIDDDFMAAVFEERACAEFLLQIILKRDDLTVKEVHGQYNIKNLQGRSVRLDILAVDRENRAYNIEVQRSDRGASEKRARYNSSLLDANLTDAGNDYDALNETYVIFITENDVLKAGLPIYHVDRTIRETGTFFNDQAHIVYVNSQIKDETALGKLMHDFFCTNSKDMNYSILAQRVRYFKEDTKGVAAMCRAMEKMRDETEHETSVKHALAMLADGVPCEKVAKYTDLSIEEVRALAEKKSA